MADREYDLAIVGGGLAGMTSGLYASRAGLKTVLLERLMTGGQIINAETIENFPGFPDGISGADLAGLAQDQATRYGLDLELDEVTALRQGVSGWTVETYDGELSARAVVVAGGSTLRRLGVPGEEEKHGAGVSYCATCDGNFFKGQDTVVVGGGDAAIDEGMYLSRIVNSLTVIHRRDELRATKVLQERAFNTENVSFKLSHAVKEIRGNGSVDRVLLEDHLVWFQTIFLDLFGNQILDRNIQLFVFGIARDTDNFHPIKQWPGNIHTV